MKTLFVLSGLLMGGLAPIANSATEIPTADEILKVSEYFYKGSPEDIVLADLRICGDIVKKGKNKNECLNQKESLRAKTKNYLWMHFAAPKGVKVDKLIVHFNHGNLTHFAKPIAITGSLRYRVWTPFWLKHAGQWEVKILHQEGSEVRELGSTMLTVKN